MKDSVFKNLVEQYYASNAAMERYHRCNDIEGYKKAKKEFESAVSTLEKLHSKRVEKAQRKNPRISIQKLLSKKKYCLHVRQEIEKGIVICVECGKKLYKIKGKRNPRNWLNIAKVGNPPFKYLINTQRDGILLGYTETLPQAQELACELSDLYNQTLEIREV